MVPFAPESNFEFTSLLNFAFQPSPAAGSSAPNYMEADSRASSAEYTPTDSMSPFIESWDLPASISNITPTSVFEPAEFGTVTGWPSYYQDKSAPVLATEYPMSNTTFPSQDSWSPSSSPSETESENTPKISTIAIPLSGEAAPSNLSSRKTKKTKVEKADRLERRREKNRTSQRKFRERKEQYIQELERQCSDLQTRCDSLLFLLSDREPALKEKDQWNWPETSSNTIESTSA